MFMLNMNGQDFGIFGLGVMGRNLALNVEEKGFSVAAFDLWNSALEQMSSLIQGKQIVCSSDV